MKGKRATGASVPRAPHSSPRTMPVTQGSYTEPDPGEDAMPQGYTEGVKMKRGGKVAGGTTKARLDQRKRGGGIHIKPSHKGLLHKDLGVALGKPIPAAKLEAAKDSSDPAERKRATFAINAKHFK